MNVNSVFFGGNLTRPVELRYTADGTALAKFGVAANRSYKDKNGEKKQKATFVDCTAWGARAEAIAKYLGKGDPILVEGRLDFSSWTDKENRRCSKLEISVDQFHFVGSKRESEDAPAEDVPF